MTRRRSKGRRTPLIAPGRFFALHRGITQSEAWRTLKPASIKVYIELRARHDSRPEYNNNGILSLSCEEAAELLHMSKGTAWRAFKELEGHGFIRCTKTGSIHARMASEFAITDMPMPGALESTSDWKNWEPKKQNVGTDMERCRYPDETNEASIGTRMKPVGTDMKRSGANVVTLPVPK